MFAAWRSFASATSEVAKILIPNTVKPLVKLALFARAVVTRFEELSPTLTTTPDVVPVLLHVIVDEVDEVDEVEVFFQPIIRNNGKEKTRIILNHFIFSSSGNNQLSLKKSEIYNLTFQT
jgi:hypothetical protein